LKRLATNAVDKYGPRLQPLEKSRFEAVTLERGCESDVFSPEQAMTRLVGLAVLVGSRASAQNATTATCGVGRR
jgi:hypothetical protein